jgi:hypothetical protein
VVDEVEQHRSLLSATVLISARLLPVLRDHFGRHCEFIDTLDDGRVRVRVAAPMAISIAEKIAEWGGHDRSDRAGVRQGRAGRPGIRPHASGLSLS